MPRVSVIIPTYQCGNYISRAIESVLAQTYRDYEIIVIDDGSTDNTHQVLTRYDGQICLIEQKNQGVATARNSGILRSNAELFAFLDADDYWLPDKLAQQITLMDQDPSTGLVYSDMYFAKYSKPLPINYFSLVQPQKGNVFPSLFLNNFIPTSTVVVRRTSLDMTRLFDPRFSPCEDYDLWLRIARNWRIDFTNQPLAYYDIREGSLSRNDLRMILSLLAVKQSILASEPDMLRLPEQNLENGYYKSYFRAGRLFLMNNDRWMARFMINQYKNKRGSSIRYRLMIILTYLPAPLLTFLLKVWEKNFPINNLSKVIADR